MELNEILTEVYNNILEDLLNDDRFHISVTRQSVSVVIERMKSKQLPINKNIVERLKSKELM